jgi:hypothetical protein
MLSYSFGWFRVMNLGKPNWRIYDIFRVISTSLILFLVGVSRAPASAEESSVEQTIDAVDGAIQSVKSWDIRVQCTTQFFIKQDISAEMSQGKEIFVTKSKRKYSPGEKHTGFIESYRQVFQRGKGRIEHFKPIEGQHSIGGQPNTLVFDGEMQKTFNDQTMLATIGMPSENMVPSDGWHYLQSYRNIQGQWPIPLAFRERKNTTVKKLDSSLMLLESVPCPGTKVSYPYFGFRVVLDKKHGFMPAVIEQFQEIQGKNFTMRKVKIAEWKSLGGGLWAPIKVVTDYFYSDPKWPTFGELYSEDLLVVDVARSTWNESIPEETFNLALPAGTKVQDTLREVQYVTGQADPGKNLQDLAANAKDMIPYPVFHPLPPEQPLWQKHWVLVVAACSVFALFLIYFVFRLRNRWRKV